MRRGGPNPQEFITKVTQELQESRVMHGDHRLPGVAPHPVEDGGLRVCIDYPGLNRVASQEHFWPLRVGRCEGPPHSYICMPFSLPNAAAAHQRLMRSRPDLEEPPGPPEAPEAQGSEGS